MFIYGALVENRSEDERADIEAILNGTEPPSATRERDENRARLIEFAFQGEVAGEVAGADR